MAALTHGFQVFRGAIFWRMVQVRHGQDYAAQSEWVQFAMNGAATVAKFIHMLTAPLRALANSQADLFPVCRISRFVFRADWHGLGVFRIYGGIYGNYPICWRYHRVKRKWVRPFGYFKKECLHGFSCHGSANFCFHLVIALVKFVADTFSVTQISQDCLCRLF
jgi:hypothetical protein